MLFGCIHVLLGLFPDCTKCPKLSPLCKAVELEEFFGQVAIRARVGTGGRGKATDNQDALNVHGLDKLHSRNATERQDMLNILSTFSDLLHHGNDDQPFDSPCFEIF